MSFPGYNIARMQARLDKKLNQIITIMRLQLLKNINYDMGTRQVKDFVRDKFDCKVNSNK